MDPCHHFVDSLFWRPCQGPHLDHSALLILASPRLQAFSPGPLGPPASLPSAQRRDIVQSWWPGRLPLSCTVPAPSPRVAFCLWTPSLLVKQRALEAAAGTSHPLTTSCCCLWAVICVDAGCLGSPASSRDCCWGLDPLYSPILSSVGHPLGLTANSPLQWWSAATTFPVGSDSQHGGSLYIFFWDPPTCHGHLTVTLCYTDSHQPLGRLLPSE
jgi:hypothetical protein